MSLEIFFGHGGTMGTAEDWADSLAKRVQEKQAAADHKARVTAMNREIEAEGMPRIWTELLAEFQKCCEAFNRRVQPERELACIAMSSHHFMVRPEARPEIVTGDYDPHTKSISIATPQGKETFVGSVIHEGTGVLELVSLRGRRSVKIETIAREAIEAGIL